MASTAAAYLRPHEIDVSRADTGGGLWAALADVTTTGAVVRLKLIEPGGETIRAEIGRQQFERIGVGPGDRVYVTPRTVRVFVE